MKLLVTLIATVYSQGERGGGRGREKEREVPEEVTDKPDYLDGNYGAFDSYSDSNYGELYNFGDSYGSIFGDDSYNYDADYNADVAAADAVEDFAPIDGGFGDYDGGVTTFAPVTIADRPAGAEEEKGRPSGPTDPPQFQKFLGAGNNFCNLCSGRDPVDCLANRDTGAPEECPPGNVCGLEVRTHKGGYKNINIRCMSVDECNDSSSQNWINNNAYNGIYQCRPSDEEFLTGAKGRTYYGESVCRNCVAPCATSAAADCFDPTKGVNDGASDILPINLKRADWEADLTTGIYSNAT